MHGAIIQKNAVLTYGSGGKTPCIFNFGKLDRDKLSALKPHRVFRKQRNTGTHWLGKFCSQSYHFEKETILPFLPGIEPRFLGRTICSLVPMRTELLHHATRIT